MKSNGNGQAAQLERNLQAVHDVMAAYERLTDAGAGLTTGHGSTRGLTGDGFQQFADLLAVAMLQTGGGTSTVEQTMSACSRATLSALSCVFAGMAGQDLDLETVRQHLRAAIKATRA